MVSRDLSLKRVKKDSKKRNGVGGGSASTLIVIITFMIVLYILFISPEERVKLLGDENATSLSTINSASGAALLKASPGRLMKEGAQEVEKDLPGFTVYSTVSAKVLHEENPFVIKANSFEREDKTIEFSLNPLLTRDVILSFNANGKGTMTIRLNGNKVFEGPVSSNSPPIKLDGKFLLADNKLSFRVKGVGILFWMSNQYEISNLKIIGNVKDESRKKASLTFTLSEDDMAAVKSAELRFVPDCIAGDTGVLSIRLNNELLFEGVPDCSLPNNIDIPAAYLNTGENLLLFESNRGSYTIGNLAVKLKPRTAEYPLYSFDVNGSIWNDILNGNAKVKLKMDFIDDGKLKNAIIYVNTGKKTISTDKAHLETDITSKVRQGDNTLKIVPESKSIDLVSVEADIVY